MHGRDSVLGSEVFAGPRPPTQRPGHNTRTHTPNTNPEHDPRPQVLLSSAEAHVENRGRSAYSEKYDAAGYYDRRDRRDTR